jgi:hypothetical protein
MTPSPKGTCNRVWSLELPGELCRCALRSLTCYFETVAHTELRPGIIAAIQTFGAKINSIRTSISS